MSNYKYVAVIPRCGADWVDFFASKTASASGSRFHEPDMSKAMLFRSARKALRFASRKSVYRNPANARHVQVRRVAVTEVPACAAHRVVEEV